MWSCKVCTLENADSTRECELCHNSKDVDKEHWQCLHCYLFNTCDKTVCAVCNYPRLPDDGNGIDTVWVCQKKIDDMLCLANNKINDLKCFKCSASRPYIESLRVLSKLPVTEAGLRDLSVSDEGPGAAGGMGGPERRGGRGRCSWSTDQTEDGPAAGSGSRKLSEPSVGACARPDYGQERSSWQDETVNYYPSDETEEEIIEFPDSECRMVLVGKTGLGKSSTANTIIGMKNHFTVSPGFNSETKICERVNKRRFGIQLEVMDTPGLFDTTDQTFVATEIAKCMAVMAPGPHAIILVLRFGLRFTEEEAKAIDKVYDIFGHQLLRFLVIVFTHADNLTEIDEKTGFETQLSSAPAKLKKLIEDSQQRYVLFNNKADEKAKDAMVKKLLETIKNLLKVNGGRPYSSALLNKVENKMLERERQLESQYGVQAIPATDRKKGGTQFWREIARDEVVHEKPLLDKILQDVLPTLIKIIQIVIPILMAFAGAVASSRSCEIL